jgi:long-chain acyl-CoA synthetase
MTTPRTNLGDLIDRRTIDLGKTALIDLRVPDSPRLWTHGEIDRAAGGVAQALEARGLPRGARAAILAQNRAEYAIAYFGIMRAGLVAVPVNTRVAQDTIDFVMRDAEIRLAFADAEQAPRVPSAIPVIGFDDPGPRGFEAQCPPVDYATKAMGPDEIGQMLYTSGSTGRPKGVPLTHAGQLWALSLRPVTPDERHMIAQPLFHMNGLMALKGTFWTGASTVLMPGFDAKAYTRALAEWRVTSVMAVPTMFARVIKETGILAAHDYSALKRIMLGSAPLTMGLIERVQAAFPGASVANGYGTTEAGPGVFGPHPDGIPTPPLALGYPVRDIEVRLVDGPSEEEGVLLMRTPATMSGYNNLPQKTAEVLSPDGWYRSGDVMHRDANGFYFFVGRADDMFVCSGENIWPAEVEKMLERHEEIQAAAVVPLPDEERSAIPVAFVVPRAPGALTVEAVKRWALDNGPAYQHPRRVLFVPELPWAGTNKIDRKALIDRARALEAEKGWTG